MKNLTEEQKAFLKNNPSGTHENINLVIAGPLFDAGYLKAEATSDPGRHRWYVTEEGRMALDREDTR